MLSEVYEAVGDQAYRRRGLVGGEIVRLASQYGRYVHRRMTALLKLSGSEVKHKRVEKI